jgi:regulator of protease activity HflC (stomatin/prohibitin superfamily)
MFDDNKMPKVPKVPKINLSKLFGSGLSTIAVIVIIALALSSFVIVDSGHVGVVRTLGAVQPVSLAEGFHLKKPLLDKVEQVDIRLNREVTTAASASKDLQNVRTKVTVQYSLTGSVAPQTFQKIGTRKKVADTLIDPAIQESVKAVTAQYTAEELVTKRAEVKTKIHAAIDDFINETLKEKGVENALRVANVAITDFDFSADFNHAIEQKVKAEQDALKAKNEKIRRVTNAEAAAKEKTLSADANAYQIRVQSIARAAAIKREAAALRNNRELIQLRLAEKWNGVLPQVSGGGSVPLINMDGLSGKEK